MLKGVGYQKQSTSRPRPQRYVFPEDLDCVYQPKNGKGGIFIGNLQAAENLQTLKKHKICSLLTACRNVHIRHPKTQVPYTLYIPGEDHQNYDLSLHFDTATDFIHQARKETNILVHCMAGISRSATLVLAYMMKFLEMPFQQAFDLVSDRRRKINPNPGFVKQLKKLQQTLSAKQLQKKSISYDLENITSSSYYYKPSSYKTISQMMNSYKVGQKSYSKLLEKDEYFPSKKYNPQQEEPLYQSNLLYNPLGRQSYPEFSYKYLQESRRESRSPLANHTNFMSASRDGSIESLSRDLDERIAKIKQKYYERANLGRSELRSREKISNFSFEEMKKSTARDSFRNSIYDSYKARPMSYKYV